MSRRSSTEDVELNVTAMLDMAFQLLAFFVLTFKAPPGEAQIYLNLPPAQPPAGAGTERVGGDPNNPKEVKTTKTLMVTLMDRGGSGTISDVRIGIPSVGEKDIHYDELENELRGYFKAKDDNDTGQKGNAQGDYEQVVVNGSSTLRWDSVFKVMEMFTKFTTAKGDVPSVSITSGPDPGG
jgi:biopolymer transport protein ExbD